MAIRLGENIYHGKIDASVKGKVTGELVLEGYHEPVVIELVGNAMPDLAGRILTFRNPSIEMLDPYVADALEAKQTGLVGEMTASKKQRVPVSPEEPGGPNSVWKNTLFLEWFSHYNGRIVIEAVDYRWEIDEPRFELTEEEIEAQNEQAAAAMNMHLNFAVEMFRETNREIREAEAEIDPDADDEFSWEKRLRESDRRADAFHALMEEARTPEEMEALAEMAYADDDEEDFDPPAEPDFSSGGGDHERKVYRADAEVAAICKQMKKTCKGLIKTGYEMMLGTTAHGDFLSLIVKSQTLADMTSDEFGGGFERGFLIAHAKREIARVQRILTEIGVGTDWLECSPDVLDDLWKLRELLVSLAGKLRS